MNIMDIAEIILIAISVLLILWLIKTYLMENYESRREKAQSIHKWFRSCGSPEYVNYKDSVEDSDIVEYSKAKELYRQGKLTVGNVEKIL